MASANDLSPSARSENWGSRLGVIMAVAGSAVGLGNFLRFPGLAATNGGGLFLIPYFTALVFLGIPLVWVEWTLGRYGGARGHHSPPGIFTMLWPTRGSKYIGILALMVPLVVYMYYVYIEAWCLAYAWDYARGALGKIGRGLTVQQEVQAYTNYFHRFVGYEQNGWPSREGLIVLILVAGLNFYLIYRGITRGIEKFCTWAVPLMILIALVVLVRVLTLGAPDPTRPELNVNAGLGFMWNPAMVDGRPDFSILSPVHNPQIWLKAASQIFFSISIAFGSVLTYASYLKRNDDVALSGFTAGICNEFCEVCLGGLITVPVAFIFLGPELLRSGDLLGGSFAVGFRALPAVFARMPAGEMFAALWFFMLFLAAITSSLSQLQPGIAFLQDGFNLERRAAALFLLLIVAIGNLIVIYFSRNMVALNAMDFWVGTVFIFILATFQTIIFGWILGIDRAREELERGALMKLPRAFWFTVKYISPLYLLTVFALWLVFDFPGEITRIRNLDETDRNTTFFVLGFIVALLVFFFFLIMRAGVRWEREGRGVAAARRAAARDGGY